MESPLIIFSHWIIFTRTTRLIDRIAVLCFILGSLFSGSWSGLHGRPGQCTGPFVPLMVSKPPNNLLGSTRSVCPPQCIFKMIFICTFQQLVRHFVTVIIPYIPVHITSVTNLTSSRESLWFLVLQVPMDHGWTYCFGPDWCLLVLLLGHKNWTCFWRVFFVQKGAILKSQTLMKTHKNFAQKKNVPILVFLILGVPKWLSTALKTWSLPIVSPTCMKFDRCKFQT